MTPDLVVRGGRIVDGSGGDSFTADVAIEAGRIVGIGKVDSGAREEIDADGALVTPGWIDVHTHYDGQVTWDRDLVGSAANGVTTVVMGNCGVGFAPVKKDGVETLIDIMEGVEDIPGTALYEGVPWGAWERFEEYLDFLAARNWSLDVGAQVPHGALRYYVMGDRAVENLDASAEDLDQIQWLCQAAVRRGALGVSTSRIQGHKSMKKGLPVPGTYAPAEELYAIARGIASGGGGVLQAIPSTGVGQFPERANMPLPVGFDRSLNTLEEEVMLFGNLSRDCGIAVTFTTVQRNDDPSGWQSVLATARQENRNGARLFPQVGPRGIGTFSCLQGYHMFMRRPTYLGLTHLSHSELVQSLSRAEVRMAILQESDVPDKDRPGSMHDFVSSYFSRTLDVTFPMKEPIDYEPDPDQSIAGRARQAGIDPAELMYDFLLEDEGRAIAYNIALNYASGSLEPCREMLENSETVPGLSDAGAHVNFQCDMSNPTFMLTHWARDRHRGDRMSIEYLVNKSTAQCARAYGLRDRGLLRIGARADLNVIDFDRLRLHRPVLLNDLPAGGSRFVQTSSGYLATIVNGVTTRRFDESTGRYPGRLVVRSELSPVPG